MRRVNLQSGEYLFHEGDTATSAYFVLRGVIEISSKELSVNLEKYEIFGESGLVGNTRMADAIAQTDCCLIAFSVDELRNSIRTEPDTAERLVEILIRRLAYTVHKLEKLRSTGISTPMRPQAGVTPAQRLA